MASSSEVSTPLVSVLLPVKDQSIYIAATVESILEQTIEDFELLILDDGSTDDSVQICRDFAQMDSRVRVTSQSNRGVCASRNILLRQARSELIAFCDGDNINDPRRLEILIRAMGDRADLAAVGSFVNVIDSHGSQICLWRYPIDHESIDQMALRGNSPLVLSSSIMRRSCLEAVGGFREDLRGSEDLDIYLKLAESYRLMNHPEPLLKFRVHLQSLSALHSTELRDGDQSVLESCYLRRGIAPDLCPKISRDCPKSPADFYSMWGWNALKSGNIAVARRMALKCLLARPGSLETYRLLVCSLRGY